MKHFVFVAIAVIGILGVDSVQADEPTEYVVPLLEDRSPGVTPTICGIPIDDPLGGKGIYMGHFVTIIPSGRVVLGADWEAHWDWSSNRIPVLYVSRIYVSHIRRLF